MVLNVTVTQPSVGGYVTVYPSGTTRPNASNLNFAAGQTIPNLVIAKVGTDGNVAIYNDSGTTHVIADVAGWFATPSPVLLSGATQIASGDDHTCVLVAGGKAKCWGYNGTGQLGNGTRDDSSTPVDVTGIAGATQIVASTDHTCALLSGGTIKCWGDGRLGRAGRWPREHVLHDARGGSRDHVVRPTSAWATSTRARWSAGGQVKCWGSNNSGEIGLDWVTTSYSLTPVTVPGIVGATEVTAGLSHTCALVSGGVECWGSDTNLGNGDAGSSYTPVAATGVTGATHVRAGQMHTCAVVTGGAVKCWGGNPFTSLGDGSSGNSDVPVTVSGLTGAVDVAPGLYHTCAVLSGGQLSCWGNNGAGQLGNNSTINAATPVAGTGITNAVQVRSGLWFSCALLSSGQVKCWGEGSNGKLGNGKSARSLTPVSVVA